MKKFLGFFLGLFIVLGGLYTGFWWKKSNELKQHVQIILDHLAANEKSFRFEYEGIERRGFPAALGIAIKNPRLISSDSQEEIALNGTVDITSHLLDTQHVKSQLTGNNQLHLVYKDPDTEKYSTKDLLLSGNLVFNCACENLPALAQSSAELSSDNLLKLIEGALQDFAVHAKNFSILDENSNKEQLFAIDQGDISFNLKKKTSSVNDLALAIDLKNLKIFDKVLVPYTYSIDNVTTLKPNLSQDTTLLNLVLNGKATIPSSDHSFYHTFDLKEIPAFSFIIDQYQVGLEDKWKKSSSKGTASLSKEENQQIQMHFASNDQSEYHSFTKEEFFQYFSKSILNYMTDKSGLHDMQAFIANYAPDLIQLTPDLSSLGKLSSAIDFSFIGKQNHDTIHDYKVNMKNLDVKSDLYSLNFTGQVQDAPLEYNSELTIINYQKLFHSLADYYNQWITFLKKADSKQFDVFPLVTVQVVDRFNQFLKTISNNPTAQSDQITLMVKQTAPGLIQVGNLTMGELIQAYTQLVFDISMLMAPQLPANPETN
jgi:hypothetical protein